MATRPDIGFFEVHAENYMIPGGPFHHYLTRIHELYALSVNRVGLSIGADEPLDVEHQNALAVLLRRYQPKSFSEHLAWSTHSDVFLNDLLPLPYNTATARECVTLFSRLSNRPLKNGFDFHALKWGEETAPISDLSR